MGADLRRAWLKMANLRGANLRGADLTNAILRGAILQDTHLEGADLSGADLAGVLTLAGADMTGATLTGAILPTGETWEEYSRHGMAAFLTHTGTPLAEVLAYWDARGPGEWGAALLRKAFRVTVLNEMPEEQEAHVEQFIVLFDSGLLPRPVLGTGRG